MIQNVWAWSINVNIIVNVMIAMALWLALGRLLKLITKEWF